MVISKNPDSAGLSSGEGLLRKTRLLLKLNAALVPVTNCCEYCAKNDR